MSFIDISPNSDFPLNNIPFAIISTSNDSSPRPATAIGDFAVDLKTLADCGAFKGPILSHQAVRIFSSETLNEFMALGRPAWREARATLQDLLSANGNDLLRSNDALKSKVLIPLDNVTYHLPADIGDYTDFYASKEHATNLGAMFRGPGNELMPNWVHIPVGYHGRASSVVVSGTPIKRPSGMVQDVGAENPHFDVCKKLDIELEVAFLVGVGNNLGDRIPITEAEDHIFGMVIMNDWSARDIQKFEYVPLGPFLGKNFGTTISPWVVTLDALEEFKVAQPVQDPVPAEYLLDKSSARDAYDVQLQVIHKTPGGIETVLSNSNLKYMYWTFKQQLAHHSVNGCNTRTGDLMGSGTISGPTRESLGSMLEMNMGGKNPIKLSDGSTRTFLEDGDEIILKGVCSNSAGSRLGFGIGATGKIYPAPFNSRSI